MRHVPDPLADGLRVIDRPFHPRSLHQSSNTIEIVLWSDILRTLLENLKDLRARKLFMHDRRRVWEESDYHLASYRSGLDSDAEPESRRPQAVGEGDELRIAAANYDDGV